MFKLPHSFGMSVYNFPTAHFAS